MQEDGQTYKMLMLRNPFGSTGYTGVWHQSDSNWTAGLKSQVPHGINVDESDDMGIFFLPMDLFMDEADCL